MKKLHSSQKPPFWRFFKARLRPFLRPMFWISTSTLGLVVIALWQYKEHPDWLSIVAEQPEIVSNNLSSQSNSQDVSKPEYSLEDLANGADIDNLEALLGEFKQFNKVSLSSKKENSILKTIKLDPNTENQKKAENKDILLNRSIDRLLNNSQDIIGKNSQLNNKSNIDFKLNISPIIEESNRIPQEKSNLQNEVEKIFAEKENNLNENRNLAINNGYRNEFRTERNIRIENNNDLSELERKLKLNRIELNNLERQNDRLLQQNQLLQQNLNNSFKNNNTLRQNVSRQRDLYNTILQQNQFSQPNLNDNLQIGDRLLQPNFNNSVQFPQTNLNDTLLLDDRLVQPNLNNSLQQNRLDRSDFNNSLVQPN